MKRGDRGRAPNELPERRSTIGDAADPWLEWGDQAIYVAAAILFLAAAAAMGGYSVITFIRHIGDDFPLQLVTFINDLLLVLIILEILGTIRSYLLTGATSLAPFLYIGIISATRRVLAIGAASTLGGAISETDFRDRMIDLGANGGVVLALAVALYLFGRDRQPAGSDPGDGFDN